MSVLQKKSYTYAGSINIPLTTSDTPAVVGGVAFGMTFDITATTDIVYILVQMPSDGVGADFSVDFPLIIDSVGAVDTSLQQVYYSGGKQITSGHLVSCVSNLAIGAHALTATTRFWGASSGSRELKCDGDIPFKVSIVVVPGA